MIRLLPALLVMADVVLASLTFIAFARPDVVIGWVIRSRGLGEEWFQEHVGDEELARLRALTRVGAWVGLGAVFGLAFITGAVAAAAR